MELEQIMIISLLLLMLVFFAWGKWRYDLVSVVTLLIATIVGLVSANDAFSGFGHPAVITVAAVLIVSKGLMNSGIVDLIARYMNKVGDSYIIQLMALVVAVTISSAFMNNIGALALFMPVAIKLARKSEMPVSLYLMPLAFGSLLGGLMTLVGTPPNIIISGFRADSDLGQPFTMFDFAPVGGGVALVGVIFIALIGWRLIPERKSTTSKDSMFEISEYISALIVPEDFNKKDVRLSEIEKASEKNVVVITYYSDGRTFRTPSLRRIIKPGDKIVVEGNPEDINLVMEQIGLKFSEAKHVAESELKDEEITTAEVIVMSNSRLVGRTARHTHLRTRFGVNLLGVAREGSRLRSSPDRIIIRAGDVLLLQGGVESLQEVLPIIGCLPLAERELRIGQERRVLLGTIIFAVSIALAAFSILPVQIAFTLAAVLMILLKFINLRELYDSIDWPIIVLLGSIIPVSQALETTGSAQLIADKILIVASQLPAWLSIALLLTVTMLLSNVVNNAAAALIMAPIALQVALGMSLSIDAFLMAVAVGASCAFLTPIGHQSNTLVMGPGGYKFGDYWKLGLPMSIIVVISATMMITIFWPL